MSQPWLQVDNSRMISSSHFFLQVSLKSEENRLRKKKQIDLAESFCQIFLTNTYTFINSFHRPHITHIFLAYWIFIIPQIHSLASVFIYFNFLSIRTLQYYNVKMVDTLNLCTRGYLWLHMVSVKTKVYVTTLTPKQAVRNPLLNWDYQFAADNSVGRNDGH